MEKDFGSWFHHQHHSQRLSNYLNYLGAPLEVGWESSLPNMNPHTNELSIDGTFPAFAFSELPHSKASQPNEPSNWFYSLPPCPEAFAPAMNSLPEEKLPLEQKCFRTGSPNVGTAGTRKKFLVFDQSGDQTTLIYSSELGTPVQCLASWNPKPPVANDLVKEDFGFKKYIFPHFVPFVGDECNGDNPGDELDSEMHEDTEELNALLYSDDENENGSDDDDDDDDEVTSTGHSPSTMTERCVQDWFEAGEEVGHSASPTKKRKLSHGDLDAPSPTKMPSSEKSYKRPEFEDDAESSCGNFDYQFSEDSNSSSKKRSRKEKIRQTISILQSIIPGGKGKDTILVIDEAINYLKSLKVKAKSLGLDAL